MDTVEEERAEQGAEGYKWEGKSKFSLPAFNEGSDDDVHLGIESTTHYVTDDTKMTETPAPMALPLPPSTRI